MATLARRRNYSFIAALVILSAFTLLGLGLGIYRLVAGLGATTHMSDSYPWGIWVTFDMFLIPVAGAAFTVTVLSYFMGREMYHAVLRPAVLAGLLGEGVVAVLLFMDIGRWRQFYNIIWGPVNSRSFLEWVSVCLLLYTIILALEFAPVILEKWGLKTPIRWIERSIYILAGVGVVLSIVHQSSLGAMLLLLRYKLHPLWWTPALPMLFFLQAVCTGLGMTAVAVNLVWRAMGLPINRDVMRRIGQAMSLNLILYVALKAGSWMGGGQYLLLFRPDPFAVLAWLELIIGAFIPMAILFTSLVSHSAGPFWAGVFVIIGTFINRVVVTWIGLAEPSPVVYYPSWVEIFITVGVLAGAFLVYGAVVRNFRLFPKPGEAHP